MWIIMGLTVHPNLAQQAGRTSQYVFGSNWSQSPSVIVQLSWNKQPYISLFLLVMLFYAKLSLTVNTAEQPEGSGWLQIFFCYR